MALPAAAQTTGASAPAIVDDEMSSEDLADEAARGHFRLGLALYREGRATAAAVEFQRAYELSGRAELYFNLYVAHRDAGEIEAAAEALAAYLAADLPIEDRGALELRLAALRQRIEADRLQAELAETERAGRERLEREQAETDRARAAADRARLASEEPRVPHWTFWVGGIGLGGLAAGGVTSLMTVSRQRTLDGVCPDHTCPRDRSVASETNAVRRTAITTDALLATGGTALVVGIVSAIVQRRGHESSLAPAVAWQCVGSSCGLLTTVAGTF